MVYHIKGNRILTTTELMAEELANAAVPIMRLLIIYSFALFLWSIYALAVSPIMTIIAWPLLYVFSEASYIKSSFIFVYSMISAFALPLFSPWLRSKLHPLIRITKQALLHLAFVTVVLLVAFGFLHLLIALIDWII